jgi:hypothetical protein
MFDAKMLDSTSMDSSCMENKVVDLLKFIGIIDLGRGFSWFVLSPNIGSLPLNWGILH